MRPANLQKGNWYTHSVVFKNETFGVLTARLVKRIKLSLINNCRFVAKISAPRAGFEPATY